MENNELNQEQQKMETFFKQLYDKSVKKVAATMVIGIFQFIGAILCMIPIQELLKDTESPFLMPIVLTIFSTLMVTMRASLFREYVENQKSRKMTDILKYYPISKRVIWEHKMTNLASFMAKMTTVGLILQVVGSYIAYKEISRMNFLYIIVCVFLLPLACELLVDITTGDIRRN